MNDYLCSLHSSFKVGGESYMCYDKLTDKCSVRELEYEAIYLEIPQYKVLCVNLLSTTGYR